MRTIFQIICLLSLSLQSLAKAESGVHQYWIEGNKAYQQKLYDSAIFYYTKVLEKQPENGIVFYNLANAHYKNNQIAEAVLHYERALFYDPGIKDAKENLLMAKSRIPNAIKQSKDIFFVEWWKHVTSGNTATNWAIASVICFLIFLTLVFFSKFKRSNMSIPYQVFIFIPLVNLLILFCAFIAAKNATSTHKAVVMNNTSIMTTAPGVYKGQIMIPEATTVETGDVKGKWIAITLPDNRTGWVQIKELTFIQSIPKK